jgi:hypothetical protein
MSRRKTWKDSRSCMRPKMGTPAMSTFSVTSEEKCNDEPSSLRSEQTSARLVSRTPLTQSFPASTQKQLLLWNKPCLKPYRHPIASFPAKAEIMVQRAPNLDSFPPSTVADDVGSLLLRTPQALPTSRDQPDVTRSRAPSHRRLTGVRANLGPLTSYRSPIPCATKMRGIRSGGQRDAGLGTVFWHIV